MGQPFTQIRQCSITPVSLWRTCREKTSAHGSSTPRIWKGCARSAMRVSRAASLLNLSNERLEKTVTIGGFLSATIPFATTRGILFAGTRRGPISRIASEPRRACVTKTLRLIDLLPERKVFVKRAEESMRDENLALREQIDQAFMFEEIVGSSPALQTVLSSIVKVAPTDSTVLITGETGTGKELIARAIHKHSRRSRQAIISENCATIPSSLIASELFGHEK